MQHTHLPEILYNLTNSMMTLKLLKSNFVCNMHQIFSQCSTNVGLTSEAETGNRSAMLLLYRVKLATANTSTDSCIEHEINTVAARITYIKLPCSRSIQVELGKVGGGFLKHAAIATASTTQVFECWVTSSLAGDAKRNQSSEPCEWWCNFIRFR